MRRMFCICLMIFIISSISVFSDELKINKSKIQKTQVPKNILYTIDTTLRTNNILTYTTDEVFSFESEAKKTCNDKLNTLKNFSISVIGCNILEKGNDYTYTIDYIPELKNPNFINSVIIEEYQSPKNYWNENLAKKELNNSLSKFNTSPLKVFDSQTVEVGNEYSFKLRYINENVLKKSKVYYAKFEKTVFGKYTFESDAKKDIPSAINRLKNIGVAAISGRVIENGNDYAIEIEYINKVDDLNKPSKNPLYSIIGYYCRETFPFEDDALREAEKRNEIFAKAQVNVIHNYAYPFDNDWSFAIDFVVKNTYRNGIFIGKEYLIKRYTNPQEFDLESEAKKEMQEKTNNFNSSQLYVVSSKVYETGNGYSFYIDYIEKQNYPKQ